MKLKKTHGVYCYDCPICGLRLNFNYGYNSLDKTSYRLAKAAAKRHLTECKKEGRKK